MSAGAEPATPIDWRCYRHPEREAGVRCTRCSKPICPECMITASVGFQCPTCVKGSGQRVRTMRSLAGASSSPFVTMTLIGLNVAVYVLVIATGGSLFDGGGTLSNDLLLYAPFVAAGEWWRLYTSGFLHVGLMHLGFNMFLLYLLGQLLEPTLGRTRFAVLYLVALVGGSLGSMVLQQDVAAAGASGAVFGLMGAAFVAYRQQGINPMQTQIGPLLVLNLLLSFVLPGIAWGGHLGGLIAGGVAGAILFATDGADRARRTAGTAACVALGGGLTWAALAVASAAVR